MGIFNVNHLRKFLSYFLTLEKVYNKYDFQDVTEDEIETLAEMTEQLSLDDSISNGIKDSLPYNSKINTNFNQNLVNMKAFIGSKFINFAKITQNPVSIVSINELF
jgi:hypothetical protein